MLAGKDGSVGQHLCQNTANRPDVDALAVALGVEHDLWRAVPARGHVLRQEPRVVVLRVGHACQPKITDLKVESQGELPLIP